jgi:hypothetical protein
LGEASLHAASDVLNEARKYLQKWLLNFIQKPEKNFEVAEYYEDQVVGLGMILLMK